MTETPQQAARRLAERALREGYVPQALHEYTDANGNTLHLRVRLKHLESGRKWIRPMKVDGGRYTLGEPAYPNGKPLYRLHELMARPNDLIFVCEGEWCADALACAGALATTSGGADSADKADWQALAGRSVTIWADNDEPGRRYAERVANILKTLGCTVRFVDVAALDLPPKGDAVDWLAMNPNATAEEIYALPKIDVCPHEPPSARDLPALNAALEKQYASTVELIRGSDVRPEPIPWLWHGWLAAGKLHILGGAPGTGKTTISMALAATVTTGGRWPDGSPSPLGNVVIWSGEDDPTDTLVPRLTLSGADLSRVYFVGCVKDGNERRSFDPARDMEALRRSLVEVGDVLLLIVDPIVSAIAGDSHKNAEVRRGLQPLAELAASTRCALLGITHFSKGTGGRDPVERITGSLAFGALARVVMVAAKHQEEREDGRTARVFLRAKSNIGSDDGGYEYDLRQGELTNCAGVFASCLVWGEAVEGAARELLATADAGTDDAEGGTLADAKRFLSDLLADGPMAVKAIRANADGAGYSWATTRRAQKALGIHPVKAGMKGGWEWELSRRCAEKTEDAQQKGVSTFGDIERLREDSRVIEVEI